MSGFIYTRRTMVNFLAMCIGLLLPWLLILPYM